MVETLMCSICSCLAGIASTTLVFRSRRSDAPPETLASSLETRQVPARKPTLPIVKKVAPTGDISSKDEKRAITSLFPHELAVMARKARKTLLGDPAEAVEAQPAAPAEKPPEEPEHWCGRTWSINLEPGEDTSIQVRFEGDGAHWWVSMKDRGPGVLVTATLRTHSGEDELENAIVQSIHGQTPVCRGGAVLKLRIQNQFAKVSARQIEVKVFMFRQGAQLGKHIFLPGTLLDWMSQLLADTFLVKDVKLKADRLMVVEVQRIMHGKLWERYVARRSELASEMRVIKPASSKKCCEKTSVITDSKVPLPVEVEANEHWFFHGTSASSVDSLAENGFIDNHHITHGLAFGPGCYFTECSSKADVYATSAEWKQSQGQHLCCVLLCRVTLGRARVLDSQLQVDKAKLKEDMDSGLYHSVLADREKLVGSYREFVTPASQTYPEFVVWYRREQKSGFQSWKQRQWGGDLFG